MKRILTNAGINFLIWIHILREENVERTGSVTVTEKGIKLLNVINTLEEKYDIEMDDADMDLLHWY